MLGARPGLPGWRSTSNITCAPAGKGDEVGELIAGFNEMLSGIEQRDEELARHRDHLESGGPRRAPPNCAPP